jgi:hypothetical protein
MEISAHEPLAGALLAHDEQLFASLLDRYYGPMLRFTRALVVDEEAATAAVHRAWETALCNGGAPGALPSLAARLFSLAYAEVGIDRSLDESGSATCVDRGCFELHDDRWAGHWRDEQMPEPWATASADERDRAVRQGLHALPSLLAALLILHDVEMLSGLEITAVLGLTHERQLALLHRARTMLRGAVDQRRSSPPTPT